MTLRPIIKKETMMSRHLVEDNLSLEGSTIMSISANTPKMLLRQPIERRCYRISRSSSKSNNTKWEEMPPILIWIHNQAGKPSRLCNRIHTLKMGKRAGIIPLQLDLLWIIKIRVPQILCTQLTSKIWFQTCKTCSKCILHSRNSE